LRARRRERGGLRGDAARPSRQLPGRRGRSGGGLCPVEMRPQGMPRGKIHRLYDAARRRQGGRPLTLLAAERLRGVVKAGDSVEVLDRVLDKGIVIDAWVRVSLVGIELVTVEARIVVASIDTYLKYSEAVGITAPVSRPREVTAGTEGELERMQRENADRRRQLAERL